MSLRPSEDTFENIDAGVTAEEALISVLSRQAIGKF